MALHLDQAVVLRITEFSESSQIVTFFTKTAGQVRLIAKGIRRSTKKRFAAGLDLLELGDLTYYPARGDAGLGILATWNQRSSFAGIRRALSGLYAGLYAAELLTTLSLENDPHEALYSHFLQLLAALDNGEDIATRISDFQSQLLVEIGYSPNLSCCLNCRRPAVNWDIAYLSATKGGLTCQDCEMHEVEKWRLPDGAVRESGLVLTGLDRCRMLDYYVAHLAGRRLKTAPNLIDELRRIR